MFRHVPKTLKIQLKTFDWYGYWYKVYGKIMNLTIMLVSKCIFSFKRAFIYDIQTYISHMNIKKVRY